LRNKLKTETKNQKKRMKTSSGNVISENLKKEVRPSEAKAVA